MQYLTHNTRLKLRLIFVAVGLITISSIHASDDNPQWLTDAEFGQPLFVISTHQRLGLDQSSIRLDIVVEVVNDMLMFVRDEDAFVASLDLHLSIMRTDKGRIVNEIKHLTRSVSEYELTNSKRDYTTEMFTAVLQPDAYTVKVMLEDKESKRRESVEENILVGAQISAAGNAINDVILARSKEIDTETGIPFEPTVSGMIPQPSSPLFCHFDLMRNNLNDDCNIEIKAIDESGKIRYRNSLSVSGGYIISSYNMQVSCDGLTSNRYDLIIEAVIAADTLRSATSFTINYHGLPWVIRDLDQAIQYMRYIAKSEEIARLAGELTSRKEDAFLKFWNDNFPCLDETINAKMVEYYSRINYYLISEITNSSTFNRYCGVYINNLTVSYTT